MNWEILPKEGNENLYRLMEPIRQFLLKRNKLMSENLDSEILARMLFNQLQERIPDWDIVVTCQQTENQAPKMVRFDVLLERIGSEPIILTATTDHERMSDCMVGVVFDENVVRDLHEKYLGEFMRRQVEKLPDREREIYRRGFSACVYQCFR